MHATASAHRALVTVRGVRKIRLPSFDVILLRNTSTILTRFTVVAGQSRTYAALTPPINIGPKAHYRRRAA